MRHQAPDLATTASPDLIDASEGRAPSCVATPDARPDRAGGAGCHLAPSAPISRRNMLIDPRAGDAVEMPFGVVMVVRVTLGRGACVDALYELERVRMTHEDWRELVAEGRPIVAEEVAADA